MRRISSAVRVHCGIALAAAAVASAAAEEKSTKPRIAVIEFRNSAGGAASPPLEVAGFAWSDAQAAGPMKPVFVKSWSTSGDAAPPHRGAGSNQMSMDDTAGKEKLGKPSAVSHDLRTNVVARTAGRGDPDRPVIAGTVPNASSPSVGASQSLTVGGARTESGSPYRANDRLRTAGPRDGSAARGRGLDIARVDGEIVAPATASGQATGKRQHMPIRTRSYYDQPLGKGSVWIRVATPWAGCRVGARYPSLEMAGGARRYTLQDVTVASCGGSGDADDRPTEEVAFYYNKVTVRGWDPEKKEE